MKQTRFLTIIVVILLLLNIGTLGFLWMGAARQHGQHEQGMGRRPQSPADFLTRELQLTGAQQQQYEQMHHQHHRQVEDVKESAMPYRQQLVALLQKNSADSAAILQLTDSIARTQQKTELITYYHFLALRSICTPAQRQKFDGVIEEARRMMAPRPTPPPQQP